MAMVMPEGFNSIVEDTYGIPRGSIRRDPEAAALLAVLTPPPPVTISNFAVIPVQGRE